jgi:hypothetical protein
LLKLLSEIEQQIAEAEALSVEASEDAVLIKVSEHRRMLADVER